jgi:hypothetical protein
MSSLFDFTTHNTKKISVLNTNIYIIDNFYKKPQSVLDIIESHPWNKWKSWDNPSFNGKYFLDHRHDFVDERSCVYNNFFETLTEQKIAQPGRIVTNCMRFYDKTFNDYTKYYWAPHSDLGFTGLIYLNNFESEGTNFYKQICEDSWNTPEHFEPWRQKNRYELIYSVPAKFNRLVLFDGKALCHGMAVDSDMFFHNTRINQAIFLM